MGRVGIRDWKWQVFPKHAYVPRGSLLSLFLVQFVCVTAEGEHSEFAVGKYYSGAENIRNEQCETCKIKGKCFIP